MSDTPPTLNRAVRFATGVVLVLLLLLLVRTAELQLTRGERAAAHASAPPASAADKGGR